MSELTVWSMVSYYSKVIDGDKWTDDDYRAQAIIRSAKGEPFKGSRQFLVDNKLRAFDQNTMPEVVQRVLKRGASLLSDSLSPGLRFSLVPIPNSNMVLGHSNKYRIVTLAGWFARHIDACEGVAPVLRWREAKDRSHKERRVRSPDNYEARLAIEGHTPTSVVLFDDMVTSGSQMVAAARFLASAGANVICGVSLGRAVDEHSQKGCLGWSARTFETTRQEGLFADI